MNNMPYFKEAITVFLIFLLALMSPGPDFLMISRNSLVYSRKTAIFCALGLALGILVHVTYSLVGIGILISKFIFLYNTIKLLGATYLIYIGIKSLRSQKINQAVDTMVKQNDLTTATAIQTGFLTNALNPKASLLFLSLFTQVISPNTSVTQQTVYGLVMSVMTFGWFSGVGTVLSNSWVKSKFLSIQHHLEHIFGVLLVLLGLKIVFSKK